jgi:hypothetical protein
MWLWLGCRLCGDIYRRYLIESITKLRLERKKEKQKTSERETMETQQNTNQN